MSALGPPERLIARQHARQDCGCGPCGRFPEEKIRPAVVLDYQRWWPAGRPPAAGALTGKENEDMAKSKKNGVSNGTKGKKTETSAPFERDLECALKPSEVQAKKDRALDALNEADEKKAELDTMSLPLRNSITALRKEANKLRAEAKKGTEVRKVKCVSHFNLVTKEVRVIRQDTRKVLDEETRTMNADELQEMLPLPNVPARRGAALSVGFDDEEVHGPLDGDDRS